MNKKLLVFLLFLLATVNVKAEEGEITNECVITVNGEIHSKITDNRYSTYEIFNNEDILKISCKEKISHVYIYYDKKSTTGSINGIKVGANGYLHELIKLDNESNETFIFYDDKYSIADIYIFNTETLPDWVEDWESLSNADLMLFSSHGDDEQLFFAGLMPTYIDKGKKIQVVYFTNHYNNTNRYHEQLEGLWAIGIKYYPVFSVFPDAYSESIEDALNNLNLSGYTRDDALKYEVEQIRHYKPLVVVGHDENGEYGHGQHKLNTDVLKEAISKANDKQYDPESAQKYGTWQIQKLYLHLYGDKQIELDYDIPLDYYNGKTAYEISKLGYAKHYSQQYTWFTAWLNGDNNEFTSAKQIKKYNPALYGLYYSSVGDDVNYNDMFENVKKKEININVKESPNNGKVDIKKNINKKNILSIIGSSLISIAIVGIVLIINRVKYKTNF